MLICPALYAGEWAGRYVLQADHRFIEWVISNINSFMLQCQGDCISGMPIMHGHAMAPNSGDFSIRSFESCQSGCKGGYPVPITQYFPLPTRCAGLFSRYRAPPCVHDGWRPAGDSGKDAGARHASQLVQPLARLSTSPCTWDAPGFLALLQLLHPPVLRG